MTHSKIIFLLFTFLFCSVSFSNPRKKTRVLNAIGVTGGITYSNQKWLFNNPNSTQKNNYLLGFNGGVRAELFSQDYTSWVTELQYNQKGTIEKTTSDKNKLTYLSFNNFYRIRYDMERIMPYVLVGPRVEYLLTQSTPSVPITSNFRKFHLTASVGVGIEFLNRSKLKFFTETHYNPDIMKSYKTDPLSIRAKAFELRLGVKLTFGDQRIACPPVYK